jgi:hypothetical protein
MLNLHIRRYLNILLREDDFCQGRIWDSLVIYVPFTSLCFLSIKCALTDCKCCGIPPALLRVSVPPNLPSLREQATVGCRNKSAET